MEESSKLESLTTIFDLGSKIFVVEDYQRGYKWSEQQVIDLLNDVKEFVNDDKNQGKAYCLQPIVVIENDDKKCELVDGQQRLTTIFIILSYLGKCNFSIIYNTRAGSNTFLNDLIAINGDKLKDNNWKSFIKENPKLDNVDNYHFYHAYNYVHKWFEQVDNILLKDASFFLHRIGVIYYQPEIINGVTPQKIFRNINSNKIELTNAELIKGILIINGVKETDSIHKLYKQLDIAKEWDKIEYALHNDQLWYFLNPQKSYRNRIEFLFELYGVIYVNNFKLDKEDVYSLFHALNDKDLNHVWTETVQIFNVIMDWFDEGNLELYHFVGYAITSELSSITELIKSWNAKNKDTFLNSLKIDILKKIGDNERILNASYKKNKPEVTRILLIHNILSLRQNVHSIHGHANWTSRFRFDLFNYEKWSLEHIHAQKEAPRDSFENLKPWIISTVDSLKISGRWNDNLKDFSDLRKMSKFETIDDWAEEAGCEPKLSLLNEHITKFELSISDEKVDKDKIENLALLSQGINSSIGNGYFNEKRAAIIECDKKGNYLLPTTKNVFLKFYTKIATNPYEWGVDDKRAYLDDIILKINEFRKEMN